MGILCLGPGFNCLLITDTSTRVACILFQEPSSGFGTEFQEALKLSVAAQASAQN